MEQTLLSVILKELKVKFNRRFTNTYFMEHSHKYTMYGLSRMLTEYNISNTGIRVHGKDLNKLEPPFIAHAGNDFVLVKDITDKEVGYAWKGQTIYLETENFKELWSGMVLLMEPDKSSLEPDYTRHRKEALFQHLQKFIITFLIVVITCWAGFSNNVWNSWGLSFSAFFNCIGIYISYLLLTKQMKIKNRYADKICSLFQQGDCNDILESDAAKLAGLISWSEIGLGYFMSNIILIMLFPQLANYYALINICSLPYTFWSIWYQYKVAKQWCVLCVVVQALLWVLFIVDISFGLVTYLTITYTSLFFVAIVYVLPLLVLNFIVKKIGQANQLDSVKQELNRIKSDEDLFITLLKQQKYHSIDLSVSKIIFGNTNASLHITILTNPHCAPCARMHKRVIKLMEKNRDQISIQYVFSAFDESLLQSNKFLIASYLYNKPEDAEKIYSEWFGNSNKDVDDYLKRTQIDLDDANILKEMINHDKWKRESKLMATPTILVNGYELPGNYQIEDLLYFTTLKIN